MRPTHWHVLGAGAMGCLFASQLQAAGGPTTVLLKKASGATGVRLTVASGSGNTRSFELPASTAADTGHISHLLVTTKAQDIQAALLSVSHRLDAASQVLLLANGLGYADALRDRLPQPDYFQGTTTAGAYRSDGCRSDGCRSDGCRSAQDHCKESHLEHRHVCHAGSGLTRIGQPGRALPPDWFEPWSQAVQPSVWDAEIEQALWLKLAINCAINPLTALHRCRNGELANSQLAPQVAGLCQEIMQVCAAAGFADITADLPEQVAEVLRATADNRSSMLQDVLAQRGTEIEYITGHLLRVAKDHGLAAPLNEALYRSIVDRAE